MFFVASFSQYTKRMRSIILSSVACLPLPYISKLSHKRHDFWENVTEHKMYVSIFSIIFSGTYLVLRKSERRIAIDVHISSCKVKVILIVVKNKSHWQIVEIIVKYKFHKYSCNGSQIFQSIRTDRPTDAPTWRN